MGALWGVQAVAWLIVAGLGAGLHWRTGRRTEERLRRCDFPPFFPDFPHVGGGTEDEEEAAKTKVSGSMLSLLSLPTCSPLPQDIQPPPPSPDQPTAANSKPPT